MNRAFTRALAGGVALTLLFAACGGDSDDESTDDTSETTAAADESTTTAADPAEDGSTTTAVEDEPSTSEAEEPEDGSTGDPDAVALAESINLTLGDFAEGWTEEPPSDDGSNIDDCWTENPIADVTIGEAETGSFSVSSPDGNQGQVVSMQTVVFDSVTSAEANATETQGQAFIDCATAGLLDGAPDGAEGALQVTPDDPPLTEESFGLAGALAIPLEDGTTSQGLVDLHVFRTQGVTTYVATLDYGSTGEFESTLTGIYQEVASRHAANVQ